MKLLIDSAVAYSMDEVDMVIVGADGVVESGGIINMIRTYHIALVAKSKDKPMLLLKVVRDDMYLPFDLVWNLIKKEYFGKLIYSFE